jgi:cytochrome c556
VREGFSSLRTEVREDISSLRNRGPGGHLVARTEVWEDIAVFRAEVREDLTNFRTEVREDFADIRRDLGDVRRDVGELRSDLTRVALATGRDRRAGPTPA